MAQYRLRRIRVAGRTRLVRARVHARANASIRAANRGDHTHLGPTTAYNAATDEPTHNEPRAATDCAGPVGSPPKVEPLPATQPPPPGCARVGFSVRSLTETGRA